MDFHLIMLFRAFAAESKLSLLGMLMIELTKNSNISMAQKLIRMALIFSLEE